jgi:hypothetical protein
VRWACSADGRKQISIKDFGNAAVSNIQKEIKWRRRVSLGNYVEVGRWMAQDRVCRRASMAGDVESSSSAVRELLSNVYI